MTFIAAISDGAEPSTPNWDALIPHIFTDPRFKPTGRRRRIICLDGLWAGFAIAWRPSGYDNFGLNQEDLECLIKKIGDGSLDAGFVVEATIENSQVRYVAHQAAAEVYANLKDVPPRDGPHGLYWLLGGDLLEIDDLAEARKRFG
jgi:hypothetical protein